MNTYYSEVTEQGSLSKAPDYHHEVDDYLYKQY